MPSNLDGMSDSFSYITYSCHNIRFVFFVAFLTFPNGTVSLLENVWLDGQYYHTVGNNIGQELTIVDWQCEELHNCQ